ncbi:MAG: hypothetical protein J6O61_00625 [Butyrivibrio sp.]|uniref:hypothetical protein n=1 Tax=Butyrivibrio sp. TaxID=28121 RepID=UPI001B2DAD7E|nr:hypothetical protein [Butyrivibrio sp.]MBO6239365.1 hypothetical protein [Butyrivibrio sp.]
MKRKRKFLLLAMLLGMILSGCQKETNDELESYKESMSSFYDKLSYLDEAINGIDPESETAVAQLLGYLDEMNEAYKSMAELTIPDEFSGISDIAVEAADYMEMADQFYHEAYDNEFDSDTEYLAGQYYQRACSRVLVMLQVLHGEVPSGEGVTVTTQDSIQFSTIGTSSEE